MEKGQKRNLFERGAEFYEKFNRVLGALAIVGAVGSAFIAPEYTPYFVAFGVLQFVEAEIIKSIRTRSTAKPNPVPA